MALKKSELYSSLWRGNSTRPLKVAAEAGTKITLYGQEMDAATPASPA